MDSDKPRLSSKDAALNKALDEELAANPDAFPKAVYFIVPNELCERFAYYGINTLFNQYLKTAFGVVASDAKSIMHLFTGFAFLCPLAGAAVSDSFLGKYQTILCLSLVYLLGNSLITLFSIPGVVGEYGSYPKWSFMLPALLIALGMGGIKPCVSSHGGDQFLPSQTRLMDRFFAIFYASINIGALSSLYLTPYVKEYTTCFNHPCYALAYGIPTVTFFIALVVFIIGRRYYRVVPPQGEFLPWKSLKVATLAARRSLAAPRDERQGRHWLSYAEGDYSRRLIEETRLLGRVIVMFIPIIFYWMLYCQNGTEWQNQYEKMDKNFFGLFYIPTEASSNANPVLILVLLPLLSYVIYPFLEKRGLGLSLLGRMLVGYGILIISFLLSTSLAYYVDAHAHTQVLKDNIAVSCVGCVNGAWQFPQIFLLTLSEAMLSPTTLQFAYMEVGPQMRASATSITFLSMSLGNYLVAFMESVLSDISSNDMQWIYIAISAVFWIVFLFLSKFWFDSHLEAEANQTNLQY